MPGISMTKSKEDEEYYASGLYANAVMLQLVTDAIGRDVCVETREGRKFKGIFAACSSQFELGLKYAHEMSEGDETLLPRRDKVQEKMQFDPSDIVSLSVVIDNDRRHKGFSTDVEIGNRNGAADLDPDREFVAWEAEEDEIPMHHDIEHNTRMATGRGWSAEQMFEQNERLVEGRSDFDASMSQYTTAEVEGTDEDRRKAEQLAREIESNPNSRRMANLENDDTERDLDKETNFSGGGCEGGASRQNSVGSQSSSGGNRTFTRGGAGNNSRGNRGVPSRSRGGRFDNQRNIPGNRGQYVNRFAGMQQNDRAPNTDNNFSIAWRASRMSNFNSEPKSESRPQQQSPRGRRTEGSTKQNPSTYESNTNPRNRNAYSNTKSVASPPAVSSSVLGAPIAAAGTEHRFTPIDAKRSDHGKTSELKSWGQQFAGSFVPPLPENSPNQEKSGASSRYRQQQSQQTVRGNAWKQGPPSFRQNSVPQSTSDVSNVHHSQDVRGSQRSPSINSQPPSASPPRSESTSDTLKIPTSAELATQRERLSSTPSSSSEKKKFEFNPDAAVFTPRSSIQPQMLVCPQPQQIQSQQQHMPPPVPTQPIIYNNQSGYGMANTANPGIYGSMSSVQVSMAPGSVPISVYQMQPQAYQQPQQMQAALSFQQNQAQRPRRAVVPTAVGQPTPFMGQPMQQQPVANGQPANFPQLVQYTPMQPQTQPAVYQPNIHQGRLPTPQPAQTPYYVQQPPNALEQPPQMASYQSAAPIIVSSSAASVNRQPLGMGQPVVLQAMTPSQYVSVPQLTGTPLIQSAQGQLFRPSIQHIFQSAPQTASMIPTMQTPLRMT